ncbi:hypothetical protein LG634_00025 [Streptomyces bambusae]|uniref:hypothetical protein n=1 Tax=Streptomyces bambusae TaxID=1550616 RepID=UPI001CFD0E9B|nr:hypothetical protein [Streptomyces bambusae]MCB5163242.1 hypothetical protein [Streptomyces bambusae]
MAGIGAGVLIILSVPLAGALAGPAGGLRSEAGGLMSSLGLAGPESGPAASPDARPDPGAPDGAKNPGAPGGRGPADGVQPPAGPGGAEPGGEPQPAPEPRTDARCGPELSSPDGVEAQTCVLTGEGRTWARSYYRNTSGRPLGAVLSLMGPAGRTVQIHCSVAAGDEPDVCETPKEPWGGAPGGWTAVAEYGAPDGEGPLLLRAGSNSGEPVDG